jgi:HAD superfamily hydrolase (TIGR01509 family)
MPPRAIVFDFNGTLSDDEPILYGVYAELFAELGKPLTEREYLDDLAGETEEEIVRRWLGVVDEDLIHERIDRYVARTSDGSTVSAAVREAVAHAAAHVPVGVVSAATRAEIEPVLAAAGISVSALVSADDVRHGKPHPEPYERVAALLGLRPQEIVVFEDTEAGVASAKAAGAYVVALTRTLDAGRLAAADEHVERIDVDVIRRCLS